MASAKMQYINQSDDFLLLEQFTDGNGLVPMPSCDFVITYTADSRVPYVASRIDGVFRNCCKVSDSALLVSFDNHRLGVGALKRTLELALDNVLFADGKQNIFLQQSTDYTLVDGPTTAQMVSFTDLDKAGISAEIIAAFTRGENGKSAYEIAVENGFSGTQQEWLASLKGTVTEQSPIIRRIIHTGDHPAGSDILSGATFSAGYIDENGNIITNNT